MMADLKVILSSVMSFGLKAFTFAPAATLNLSARGICPPSAATCNQGKIIVAVETK